MKLFVNRILKKEETKLKSTFIINTPCFIIKPFFFFYMKDRNIYLLTKSRLQGTQMCSGNNDYFGIFCYFVEDIMNHSHTLQNVSITSS